MWWESIYKQMKCDNLISLTETDGVGNVMVYFTLICRQKMHDQIHKKIHK